jgi:hypothetical protein
MQWVNRIMAEFFNQYNSTNNYRGDQEKAKNIPVSMFMDRNATVLWKCQVGFIDYIVMPLLETWDHYINEESIFPAIENLKNNREYWKSQEGT